MGKKIFILTEGQTETNFVKRVLDPYFSQKEKILIPNTIVTGIDRTTGKIHKGGISSYSKVKFHLDRLLKTAAKTSDSFVTMMIDFYGLPKDTPGFTSANSIKEPYQRVSCLEKEIYTSEKVQKNIFIPYIQLHEFEALLFSDVDKIKSKCDIDGYDVTELYNCINKISNPEFINDGIDTAPSKRILKCMPTYHKSTVGVSIAEEIGLPAIRKKCNHFNEWIERLENL